VSRVDDLAMMAREAEDPEDRAWAQAEYAKTVGKPLEAQHFTPGPWREGLRAHPTPMRTAVNPLDAALSARAAERGGGTARDAALRQLREPREEPTMEFDTPTSKGKAFGLGVAQGGTVGQLANIFEATGKPDQGADALLESMLGGEMREGRRVAEDLGKTAGQTVREETKKAEATRPAHFIGGSMFGATATPFTGGPALAPLKGAAGFGAKTMMAGLEGATYAQGTGGDPLLGAAAGAGGSVLGAMIGAPARALYRRLAGSAPQKVINEAAEGTGNAASTATARKHLAAAEEGIAREVIQGPQGDIVRQALKGEARPGMGKLEEVVGPLTAANDEAYAAFEKAGRGTVDVNLVLGGLEKQAQEALAAGKSQTAKGIRAFAKQVAADAAESGGKLGLKQLRGLTSEAQEIAKSAVGGLNEHASAKKLSRVSAAASKVNDAVLDVAAEGDDALKAAAQSIRANNERISPLLTGKKALKARDYKERTGSTLRRAGKAAATPASLGVVTAVAGDDEDRAENFLLGAAGGAALSRGVPALANRLDSGLTSLAIGAARNPNPLLLSPGAQAAGVRGATPLNLNILDALMSRRKENR
jgi:hypothetical protein